MKSVTNVTASLAQTDNDELILPENANQWVYSIINNLFRIYEHRQTIARMLAKEMSDEQYGLYNDAIIGISSEIETDKQALLDVIVQDVLLPQLEKVDKEFPWTRYL